MAGTHDETLSEADLRRWKLIAPFRECLARLTPTHPSLADPRRLLHAQEYLALFLFGLLNPVVRSMRALCAASGWQRVEREVCGRSVSLGSFSEMQHLLEPALLQEVFSELGEQVHGQKSEGGRLSLGQWLAVDSSLWRALPRMHWAVYGGGKAGRSNRAVRLHVSFHLLEDRPLRAVVTEGRRCERAVWRGQWQPGDCYVGDRYFGEDHQALGQLEHKSCRYVIRLREQARVHVEEELPVTQTDRAAGVVRQAWVGLGLYPPRVRARLVWVQSPKEVLRIVSNVDPESMSAEQVALLYRNRWQVELFFRWIKCILGNRHWLAESSRGVSIQLYLALIAALLLQLYTGRRPTKRVMELVQMYLLGWANAEELEVGLRRALERRQKKSE